MMAAILILILFAVIFWLVFFKFKWLRLTPAWAFVSSLVFIHVFVVFLIGLRFVTPNSANATIVHHTIQLVPRLPQPAVVTEVLVENNVPVKKGQVLFQFDRRPYEYQVAQSEAQLAGAKQNVKVLQSDVDVAKQQVSRTKAALDYELYEKAVYDRLVRQNSIAAGGVEKYQNRVSISQATHNGAVAELARAKLNVESGINGVNTSVANIEAQLRQARYYLENTTLIAPEDGRIINLQVRPGMVSGIYRIGGIAALIVDADRYLLATYFQENLKYVQPGQKVEVALDLYPG